MIAPAHRIQNVSEYYFSKKLRQIAEMNAQGLNILNLGIGNPDLPPSAQTIEALSETAKMPNVHGYQSYTGIPELRKGMAQMYADWYGVAVNPDTEILPMMGSKEAIMHISMAFVNAGDKVLVPDPGYPTYSSVSHLVGAEIVTYDLKECNGWYPDFEAIEKAGIEGVKIMWVNYPNMPTGTPATKTLYEQLVAFGSKHNILIVNDNPYSFILNNNPMSILSIPGAKDHCIELNSLSKSHNMSGWRIGMAIGNPAFMQYILRVKSNMDSGMFRPMQVAASKALEAGKAWFDEINAIYANRRMLAFNILDAIGATYDVKQTGMFIWAKIPATAVNSETFCENILQKAHVFITPGFIFGKNGEGYLRISLCSNNLMLEEALKRIEATIQ